VLTVELEQLAEPLVVAEATVTVGFAGTSTAVAGDTSVVAVGVSPVVATAVALWRSTRKSSGTRVCTQYAPRQQGIAGVWYCTSEPSVVVTLASIHPIVTAVFRSIGLPEA